MGRALVGGLLRSGWVTASELAIAERDAAVREELETRFPGVPLSSEPVPADAAVLAVKPADAEAAAVALAALEPSRVLSIMAGVPTGMLEKWLPAPIAVLRAMPNLPAVLGAAASALSGGRGAAEDDLAWGEAVLSAFGVVARVPEHQLDAVTGLSGSGPAYLFLVAEALVEAGVAAGLERQVSRLLVNETILGAARMLCETGESPEDLREAVTSPGGTTAAGLRVLEGNSLRTALIDAVAAATERSRELGGA